MTWTELIEKNPAIERLRNEAKRIRESRFRGFADEYEAYSRLKSRLVELTDNVTEFDVAIPKIIDALGM